MKRDQHYPLGPTARLFFMKLRGKSSSPARLLGGAAGDWRVFSKYLYMYARMTDPGLHHYSI